MRHSFLSVVAATLLLVGCDKEKTTPITSANVSIDDITMKGMVEPVTWSLR